MQHPAVVSVLTASATVATRRALAAAGPERLLIEPLAKCLPGQNAVAMKHTDRSHPSRRPDQVGVVELGGGQGFADEPFSGVRAEGISGRGILRAPHVPASGRMPGIRSAPALPKLPAQLRTG